MSLLKTVIGL